MKSIRLKCTRCGGPKFIGDPYYSFGHYYVDVTCVMCSDSKDIEVNRLNEFLIKLNMPKVQINDYTKTDSE